MKYHLGIRYLLNEEVQNMQMPVNGQNGGTFGIDGEALLQAMIDSEKKRQEREASQNAEKDSDSNDTPD